MPRKFDLVVYGDGIAALSAAWQAAKAGFAVMHIARGGDARDGLVAIDREAFAATFGQPSLAELGASKVVEHRFWFLSANSGSQMSYRDGERADNPSQYLIPRTALCAWLQNGGEASGVSRRDKAEIAHLMLDRAERLQAVQIVGDEAVRCRAVIFGDGGEQLVSGEAFADEVSDPRRVLELSQRHTLDAGLLRERLGLGEGEALSGAIIGDFCSGRPSRAWLRSDGARLDLGLQAIAPAHDGEAAGIAEAALKAVAAHPSLKMLLKGATTAAAKSAEHTITGFNYLPHLYGNGWLLVGDAARLANPLRAESTSAAIHSGALAADAIGRCFRAGDTSKRAMGVFHRLLEDSFIVQNLRAQRNAVEELEKDPSLMSFYSDFFNHWFGHDTEASLEPRKARNKAFFRELRNQRPVWEFAMGMRKGLKLLRD